MHEVTIAICNYNYARFIGQAIESALRQDYPVKRILIVDDGSTDGSREVIAKFGSQVDVVFKENGGQVSAYNRAIDELDGDIALLLDSDDLLYPDAVTKVVNAFAAGDDYVKAQFKLDLLGPDGERTGACVPNSDPPEDCGSLLRKGWLYPSPPASGNAYRVDALKRIFPVPVCVLERHGADFYAIYGAALLGRVASIPEALGGYRVHRAPSGDMSFANAEQANAMPQSLALRWSVLRDVARERLDETLPEHFRDFACEKAAFCQHMYGAAFGERWRWFTRHSWAYLYAIVANPFWSPKKKIATIVLSALCLQPFAGLSDFAVRYIANPLARGGGDSFLRMLKRRKA
jgi:glycosyltransferase involved in cell wall biosynthesis